MRGQLSQSRHRNTEVSIPVEPPFILGGIRNLRIYLEERLLSHECTAYRET